MANGADDVTMERGKGGQAAQDGDLAARSADVDDDAVTVVGLGAWCDFVTDDEYRQRLVRDGWPAD